MREFNYENQGTSTWLVCDLSAEKIDTMSLGMITNKPITRFGPALYMQQDSRKYLKYNISARLSLKQYFMGTVSKKRLIGVFTSIVSALTGAEEYMIDVGSVLLDAEYIYVDVSSGKAEVLCVPVLDLDRPLSDPGLFFKNIMFCTQFDSGEDCDYVARIINYLNGTPAISLPAFGSLLRELENVTMVLADRNLPQAAADVQEQVSLSARPVPDRGTGIQPQDGMATQPGMQAPPQTPPPQMPEIPPQAAADVPAQPELPEADGKEISLFYLLQHYSKENAAVYRAQKDAKKEKKKQKAGKEPKQSKSPKAGKTAKQRGAVPPQMQIPGIAAPVQPRVPAQEPRPPGEGVPPEMPMPQGSASQVSGSEEPASSVTLRDISYGAQNGISGPIPQSGNGAHIPQSGNGAYIPQSGGNFGETTVLFPGGMGETTVLGGAQQSGSRQACLLRLKTSERILLNKPVFRIGREENFVDYFVGDNTAVGRSHANFIARQGAYFVEDTNSRNGTFVNGAMVQSNSRQELKDGDKIMLADEEFEFRMI